jgi:hypothetical protein
MGRAEDLFERLQQQGEAAIREFIAERKTEEMFLDFKRAATTGDRLHDDDRGNYAKALSGFANSEGGVIVWGVDARKRAETGDVAQSTVPVLNVPRFVSQLEAETSGATDPAVPHVRHLPILTTGTEGFAVTYIRQSPQAPHRSLRDDHYYLRTGSSFARVSHRVLRGMFGHPDPPTILHTFSIGRSITLVPVVGELQSVEVNVGIQLYNEGPGVARDVYLTSVFGGGHGGSEVSFLPSNLPGWEGNYMLGHRVHMAMADGQKLPPLAMVQPGTIVFKLRPPFDGAIAIDLIYGHGTSPASQVRVRLDARKLAGHFGALKRQHIEQNDFVRLFAGMVSPGGEG